MKDTKLNKQHIDEIKEKIRYRSLYQKSITDVLVVVAELAATWMAEMKDNDFNDILENINSNMFQSKDECVKFLKENI